MPITFNCACGKTLRVPDANAGRRAKCPACSAIVSVPAPEVEPVFEIVEDEPAAAPAVRPAAKPVEDDDSDDRTPYGLASGSSDDDSDAGTPRSKPRLPNFRKGRDKHS
jgi:hypothetical protein